jgi:hypothetical protein
MVMGFGLGSFEGGWGRLRSGGVGRLGDRWATDCLAENERGPRLAIHAHVEQTRALHGQLLAQRQVLQGQRGAGASGHEWKDPSANEDQGARSYHRE